MDTQYYRLINIDKKNKLINIKLYKKIWNLCLNKVKEPGIIDIIFFFLAGEKEINFICKNMILSEKWINDNKNILNWKYISQYQNLTPNFINEHKNEVYIDIILDKNKYIRNYPEFCNLYRIEPNNKHFLRNYFEEADIEELGLHHFFPLTDHERIRNLIRRIPRNNPRRGRLQRRYSNFIEMYYR